MPIVIAHRGASAHRPEHTLAAYELAIELGADFIEPDVVATRDGRLVARHENEISSTTDVADRREFASRRTVKEIDGVEHDGWYAIPTIEEVVALAAAAGVGVYPETKHPSYFASIGLALEEPLLAALA